MSDLLVNKKIPQKNNFNLIRMVACVIVIVSHCIGLNGKQFFIFSYINPAHLSVCIFFIISGFWITKSYYGSKSVKEFFLKRVKKICPIYYFSLIFFSIFLCLYSSLSFYEYFMNKDFFRYIIWNSVFLNFLAPNLPGVFEENLVSAVNGALWTLKIEIGFYILLPLICYAYDRLKTQRKKNLFLLIIYVCSILYQYIFIICDIYNSSPLANQLPAFMSFFISGFYCYMNYEKITEKRKVWFTVSLLFFIIHFVTQTEILLPITLSLLLISFGTSSFCITVRDYSYFMYVIHFPIIQVFVARKYFTDNLFVFIFIIIFIVFGVSCIYSKIESCFRRN